MGQRNEAQVGGCSRNLIRADRMCFSFASALEAELQVDRDPPLRVSAAQLREVPNWLRSAGGASGRSFNVPLSVPVRSFGK